MTNTLNDILPFYEGVEKQSNSETNTLSYRLRYAMRLLSISQSDLARKINVKPQIIQYLCNRNIKSSRFSFEIADALDVNYTWLASGYGEMMSSASENLHIETHKVCCIEWEKLNKYFENNEKFLADNSEYIFVNQVNHKNCFAVNLKDNSLEPRIEQGTTLIFDKSLTPGNDDFVIVKLAKSNTWVVRQLKIERVKNLLTPINNHIFKNIFMEDNDIIYAVMVQTICNMERVK